MQMGMALHLVSSSRGCGAVQALMLKAPQAHVVTDDVQDPHHLAEDQHPVHDTSSGFSQTEGFLSSGKASGKPQA